MSRPRLLLCLLFVGIVGWLVVAVGAGAVLRSGRPDRALGFAPWDARAGSRTAERVLADGRLAPASVARAGELARAALRRDATVVPAWRSLGLAEAAAGRERVAVELFRTSERLSRRDLPTQLWLIEERVRGGDVAGALRHYDIALRTNAGGYDTLMPILVAAAGNPETAPALGRLLASRPIWSGNYYYRLAQAPADAAPDPVNVARMLAIARRGGPFTNDEMVRNLLGSMVDRGAYAPALSLFGTLSGQAARPPKAVRNASFEGGHDYPPFDWGLTAETGLGAEVRSGVGGRGAALVAYASTDQNGLVARQLLMLPAGDHRFRYAAGRTEALAPARLAWRIACSGAGKPVPLDHPVDLAAGGRTRAVGFRVPPGCPAQWLSLEIGSTDPEGSEAWVDDVAVVSARAGG